jgi:hypothetical protein
MTRQDRRTKRASIGVESLEGRMVLSTSGALIAPLRGALTHGISYLDLQGSAHGTPSTVVGNPDVGTTVFLKGSGVVTGLGTVKIKGSLHGTGFIAKSHVEGSITLSNNKGSFTLQLQSPNVGGFTAPHSGTYTFNSTGGTGAYRKDFGNGTVDVVLSSKSFTLNFHGKPNVY